MTTPSALLTDCAQARPRDSGSARDVPQAEWDAVRVYVPLSQRAKVNQSPDFDRTAWVRERRIYAEELAERWSCTRRAAAAG